MHELNQQVAEIFARIPEDKPLIHHITNLVVMNDTANVTLHVGALPVMASSAREVADMVTLAGALLINNGELDWHEAMLRAGREANRRGIPIVLDPVGAGATKLRTQQNIDLLTELSIQVVRGNAGEIGVLSGMGGEVKGVESMGELSDPAAVAGGLARKYNTVAAITGKRDYVSDGQRTLVVDNGHSWLSTLTGTGCMSTTVVAAFAAVERSDYLLATAGALATYGLAAELAANESPRGPASFKVAFLDHLYNLTPEQVAQGVRISEA
jgi:hydroxyethylthiazole kinase